MQITLVALAWMAILFSALRRLSAARRTRGAVKRRLASSGASLASVPMSSAATGTMAGFSLTAPGPTDSGWSPPSYSTAPSTPMPPTLSGGAMAVPGGSGNVSLNILGRRTVKAKEAAK